MNLLYFACENNRFAVLVIGIAALSLSACGAKSDTSVMQVSAPRVVVDVINAESHARQTVLPGRVVALRTAEVRARVTGLIQARLFAEGGDVAQGQILFQIDAAGLRAELAKARGTLDGANAALSVSTDLLDRYRPLLAQEAISQVAFANAAADQKKALAARDAARAVVRAAQLDLDHATVRAPISGRIGYALVSEGALVSHTAATPLALIQSIDSVYVDLVHSPMALRAAHAATSASASAVTAVKGKDRKPSLSTVSVRVAATAAAIQGEMLFDDISIDPGTGQMRSRAVLPNVGHPLLPGMYVNATVTKGVDHQALFVSQKSLHFASDGSATVQEVDAESLLRVRSVVLGDMRGSRWQVSSGLKPGAKVVIDYADNLADGAKVTAHIIAVDAPPPVLPSLIPL